MVANGVVAYWWRKRCGSVLLLTPIISGEREGGKASKEMEREEASK